MSTITLAVEIADGHIVPLEPERLPQHGHGRLIIDSTEPVSLDKPRRRVELPIIKTPPGFVLNPTPEELDASFWDS